VSEAEWRRLDPMGVGIVAAGGQSAAYPCVSIDDEVAGRQAMDHLLFLGHRRIAMIAAIDPDESRWPAFRSRSEAYYSALRDAGIAADPGLFVNVDWRSLCSRRPSGTRTWPATTSAATWPRRSAARTAC
jgi:LacI family repressor for deo operon, udp, cdd, tsx, nupC, and nupG